MNFVIDTSVLIDILRGEAQAASVLREARLAGALHASDVTRLEVLAGMRAPEEQVTRRLLSVLEWHPLDEAVTELAGDLGRRWLPANRGIDSADLAVAATVIRLDARLLTRNVKRFPMFEGLAAPY